MAVNILLKRSSTSSKRPVGASMAFGELNLNYDAATGGLFYKDTNGDVVKVGPCQISATAPNASPAGSAGNSDGEFWYDTATSTLKVWDGSAWQETGGAVQGVTGTGAIVVDNSDPLNPVVTASAATLSAPGVVQLNNTTISTSTSEALTAAQGKVLQDQIDALAITSNLTFAGTLNTATGNLVTVTTEGSAQGFVIGSPLPAAAAGNEDFFVIITVADDSYTPPGGSPTLTHVGDWFLSDGTAWQFLDVGFQPPYASTTTPGIVELATDAEVQDGVNTDHAVTPSGLQSKVSDSVATTSSTTLASSTAVKTAYDAGIEGQTDAAAAQATADAALPKAGGVMTGDITFQDAGEGIVFSNSSTVDSISDSTSTTSSSTAASSTAVKAAYDAAAAGSTAAAAAQVTADQAFIDAAAAQATADAALPKAGGVMTGNITFQDAGEGVTFSTGSQISNISNSTSTTSSVTAASSTAVKAANDAAVAAQATADAAVPDASFTAAGDLLVGTGAGTYSALPAGAADYILASNGAGGLTWVPQSEGDVTGVTGTAPITVDNTDPQNPVIGAAAATTSAAGVVQLNNTVTSTSTSQAATANAVKLAYDKGVEALSYAQTLGIASDTTIFVNSTDGNDATGERGTTKPFLTITAALAAAFDGDTIFLSPGTFTESVDFEKGVNLVGTYNDQGGEEGTTIFGNFAYDMETSVTINPTINHIRFVTGGGGAAFTVFNNRQTAVGIATINDCTFEQAAGAPTGTIYYGFATADGYSWTNPLNMRRVRFNGHAAFMSGTTAGTYATVLLDEVLEPKSNWYYFRVAKGTVEFRSPSGPLSPVRHTGGILSFVDCVSGINGTSSLASPAFGGQTNVSYMGDATAVGQGSVYFNGYCPIATYHVVSIGANLTYGWSQLSVNPLNLQINGTAVAYTTAVPAAAGLVTASQQRPRFDLLTATSSVAANSQLATVVDSANGTLYSVSALDAGVF
jgi:hypothetical protein